MQSETFRSTRGKSPSTCGISITSFAIYLLYQTEISSPSPIFHLLSTLEINLELHMIRHTKLGLCQSRLIKITSRIVFFYFFQGLEVFFIFFND